MCRLCFWLLVGKFSAYPLPRCRDSDKHVQLLPRGIDVVTINVQPRVFNGSRVFVSWNSKTCAITSIGSKVWNPSVTKNT